MSDNNFDHIAYEILKQKQMMDELIAENRDLHRQLADLRAGHGIFIEIAGQRFPLKGEITIPQAISTAQIVQPDFSAPQPSASFSEPINFDESKNEEVVSTSPTVELESPLDNTTHEEQEQEQEKPKVPTFLEEIMIDEFATASTSPMAVWKGPRNKPDQEQIDEEQKAALRRELMGSFLLE